MQQTVDSRKKEEKKKLNYTGISQIQSKHRSPHIWKSNPPFKPPRVLQWTIHLSTTTGTDLWASQSSWAHLEYIRVQNEMEK